ncbi:MAG: Hsp70 family protein, partial [Acholeplasmataceae bacterium]|nr:Hsp70 family protein [Acholeplasmataceae bacterium]
QGERAMANDNKSLGRFQLTGIPPAPRGVPQIEVTFDIDANGIVSVKAKDLGTNKEQKITISGGSGLSDKEIDRLVKEAEEQAEADKLKKEAVELKNESENLIFQAKKAVKDLGDEVTEEEKESIEKLSNELEELLKDDNLDAIRSKKEELETAAQGVAIKAYEKAQKEQTPHEDDSSGANSSDQETVDAEFQ